MTKCEVHGGLWPAIGPMGGDEPPGPHAPCVRGGGGVKRCSHLLNGSPETSFQPPQRHASVMLREHGDTTCNHF
eukprot:3329276-Prymnesium_polylepis.1